MNKKPWSVLVLTTIFLVTPIVNIAMFYILDDRDISLSYYLKCLITLSANRMAFFNLVVPSLIAAASIYSMKRWSYPIFFLAILWITFFTFVGAPFDLSPGMLILRIVIPTLINMGYSFFLLLPSMRKHYLSDTTRLPQSAFTKLKRFKGLQ